jgi:hypothetical protein
MANVSERIDRIECVAYAGAFNHKDKGVTTRIKLLEAKAENETAGKNITDRLSKLELHFNIDTEADSGSSSIATNVLTPATGQGSSSAGELVVYTGPSSSPRNSAIENFRAPCNFVGLSNQGATCYMNSLLQTLFMAPEFREAVYEWRAKEGEEEEEEECIPMQLQNLFGNLQCSSEKAVGTKGLTKSFGWGGAEAFQQHDVQELLLLLFDSLEESFKGTPKEKLINNLFEGSTEQFIRCKECTWESLRPDIFKNIHLEIKVGSDCSMPTATVLCLQPTCILSFY